MYHGYRYTRRRYNLKKKKGYIVPSTKEEDSRGIDLWVKIPGSLVLHPVQVTQRGVAIFRKHQKKYSHELLQDFIKRSELRIRRKRNICRGSGEVFVLVRDHLGTTTNKSLASSDVRALRYAIKHIKN